MIVAIIQARMGSTRLPRKSLKEILGKPLLLHIIERLRFSKSIDKIAIATSDGSADDEIADFADKNGIAVYRGSETDLLDRFNQAAKKFGAEHIVRVWGDSVLIDPKVVDAVIDHYLKEHFDYCSNVHPPTFVRGNDVEVFSFKALETAWKEVSDPVFREYMTDYIYRNPSIFKIGNVKNDTDLSGFNAVEIDYEEDFILAKSILEHFNGRMFYMNDILEFLKQNPDVADINKNKLRYADYKEQLKKKGLSL